MEPSGKNTSCPDGAVSTELPAQSSRSASRSGRVASVSFRDEKPGNSGQQCGVYAATKQPGKQATGNSFLHMGIGSLIALKRAKKEISSHIKGDRHSRVLCFTPQTELCEPTQAMAPQDTVTVQLSAGPILANVEDGLIRARGIPYAQAERFQPPQPASGWTTPRDCTRPATLCPQLPSRLESVLGPVTRGREHAEDCLHVTVTAPRDAKDLPVLVWLHGGAFISGGGDLDCYQPLDLARRGIVCVNVSYRLGVFGYLMIPGIAPANLGLLDQRAALEWVQADIAAFGGDPGRVTAAGQSAGADSIICLLASEGTEGLLHRAILMSPPLREICERAPTAALLSARAQSLLTSDPRQMSAAELLAVQKKLLLDPVRDQVMLFAPALGHHPLPDEEGYHARLAGRLRRTPVVIGCTAHDGRPFARMMGPLRASFALPLVGARLEALGTWFVTRSYFAWPSRRFHEAALRQAGGRSSMYEFRWRPRGSALGASHCVDIPFVLGDWASWREAPMLRGQGEDGGGSEGEVRRLGGQLKDLWVAFVKGGCLRSEDFVIDEGFVFSEEDDLA
ncbi:uncharacterized protein E0L32_004543 [Thyridium curvatum]|uniref:Carboxylesterase type B domain-containing protein n=1 Tax=Thyridium curvatum TaxID=1093900 RepID=A0A507B808_9PEZI|nr:uncharacterized protein E0L32_004543 [Thyridium curvatum]TPX15266.1 hypothetical protein E0L32_004543 [Thyridium curvatum]